MYTLFCRLDFVCVCHIFCSVLMLMDPHLSLFLSCFCSIFFVVVVRNVCHLGEWPACLFSMSCWLRGSCARSQRLHPVSSSDVLGSRASHMYTVPCRFPFSSFANIRTQHTRLHTTVVDSLLHLASLFDLCEECAIFHAYSCRHGQQSNGRDRVHEVCGGICHAVPWRHELCAVCTRRNRGGFRGTLLRCV